MTTAAPLSYEALPTGPRTPFVRLSLMMLLQYAVWGIWLPILAKFLTSPVAQGGLGFSNTQMGWILGSAGSVGAVTAPFIAGQLADRIMNAERALGLLLVLGGLGKILLSFQTGYGAWLALSIVASVLYMPTLSLSNSVVFANVADREKQFPPIRMWGTIGWIIASVAFPLFFMKTGTRLVPYWPFIDGDPRADEVAQMKYAMLVSGILSIGYGIFAFALLPKTPPQRESRRSLAFAAAFKMLTRPRCIALMVAALLVSMIHQVYFFRTPSYITDAIGLPAGDIGPTMAIGQVSEIVFLAILGLFLKRIGYKWIIVLGALSYAIRYGYFGTIPSPAAVKWAMLLHGLNYGFFFAGSFLYVERIAPSDIRHSAQTVFGIIILGVGPVLASTYNGWLDSAATNGAQFDYAKFWYIQAGIALLSMVILIAAFPGSTYVEEEGEHGESIVPQ